MSGQVKSIYGLILNVTDESIEYVYVDSITDEFGQYHKSYDDPDAVYNVDKDNVYLNDCPPPFNDLSFKDKDNIVNNAYAVADMSNIKSMSKFAFERFCEIVDNGARISDKDMQTVIHHPWPQQMQKEKNLSASDRLSMAESLLPCATFDNSDEIEK